ncbi:hypothetical protein SK128_014042 [Halocaridina rubra]|uniref:Uncharacterized protein n=1 Tax=Halocaridina rubra TaxID=373956 RepID=A0AAN8XA11_HALRR
MSYATLAASDREAAQAKIECEDVNAEIIKVKSILLLYANEGEEFLENVGALSKDLEQHVHAQILLFFIFFGTAS